MEFNLKQGIKKSEEHTITENDTANTVGSGNLQVLATPVMVAWMEHTAMLAVADELPEGWTTVGTELNISHMASTPIGLKVRIEAELIEADKRRLLFSVSAYDDFEKVGEGLHERFIINEEKFMQKASKKSASN